MGTVQTSFLYILSLSVLVYGVFLFMDDLSKDKSYYVIQRLIQVNQHGGKKPPITENHNYGEKFHVTENTGKCDDPITVQEMRKIHIQEVCKKYKKMKWKYAAGRRIYSDPVNTVGFCSTPKAACTTWKVIMSNISSNGNAGPVDKRISLEKFHLAKGVRSFGLVMTNQFTNVSHNFTRFLVTRNPLDRLFSAYNEKMKNNLIGYFQGIARAVVRKYRKNDTKSQGLINANIPTFAEFVEMVVDKSSPYYHDNHWNTMVGLCNPCMERFDYILKTETLDRDMDMFLSKAYSRDKLQYVHHRRLNKAQDQNIKQMKLNPEYNTIPSSLMGKLLEKFKYDFEFYGYSFNLPTMQMSCGYDFPNNCC